MKNIPASLLCAWLVCALGCDSNERAASRPDKVATGSNEPTPRSPVSALAAIPTTPDTQAAVDALSQASPAYQPGPSVLTEGSVDGAALRARTRDRLSHDTSAVTVLVRDNARALGKAICEASVPRMPGSVPVLLKPNIGGFAWFRNPRRHDGDNGVRHRTTDPEFVRGVIRCLRARGHERITIADGWSAGPEDWQKLIDVSGYKAMAEAEGVALVALNDDGVFDASPDAPGKPLAISGMDKTSVPTLLMPKILAEHLDGGLFISLPKIKTHRFSVVSLAIKGMQGTVMYSDVAPAYRQKWRSHRELNPYLQARKKQPGADDRAAYVRALDIFAERMVDVLEVEAPHVVLAEGAPAMWGDGFNELYPGTEFVAIGGTNPVLVDAVGARYLGLHDNAELARELGGHRTSPLIDKAAQRFALDLDAITVTGDGAALVDAPRPVHFVAMAPFQIVTTGTAAMGKPSADEKPVARARHLGDDRIALDGADDEPAWRAAERVTWDTNYAGEHTRVTTHARFAWRDDALYALFEVEDTGLVTDTARPVEIERDGLYKEDCVEIFLVPDPERPSHYFEVEVGPYGHFLDLEIDRDKKRGRFDQSWSSGVRVATRRWPEKRRATIEFALESPDITGILKPGARVPMGLYRMEGTSPNKHYLAWSPPRTEKPNFHVPSAFGVLVLEPR